MPRRDRREEILQRLEVLLKTVEMDPAVVHVVRNKTGLPDERRPGIVLLDADDVREADYEPQVRTIGRPPELVTMSPQIFYLAGNLAENEKIGTDLNTARMRLIEAIYYDVQLKDIISSHGKIRYGGFFTDMKTGSAMQGEAYFVPLITYPLVSAELKE